MLRLRQYKEADAETIAQWIQDKDTFMKWGGELFGEFPINGDIIADVYKTRMAFAWKRIISIPGSPLMKAVPSDTLS
jgi:hypothetical protein